MMALTPKRLFLSFSLFMSISLLRLLSRAHYWVNKYILKHTCTQLRLFPLKTIKKKLTWCICTQTPKKEEEEEEEEEEKQLIPTKKKIRGRHSRAGTHPCAHTRPQHHKYPNNLMLLCFQTQKPMFANMAHMPAITCTIKITITHTHPPPPPTHTHTGNGHFSPHAVSSIFRLSLTHTHTHTHTASSFFLLPEWQ